MTQVSHDSASATIERYLAVSRDALPHSDLRYVPSKRYPASRQLRLAWRPLSQPRSDGPAMLSALLGPYVPNRLFYGNPGTLAQLASAAQQPGPGTRWPALPAPTARRPIPSGGGYYPVELYAAISGCPAIAAGIYHHDAFHHRLELIRECDPQPRLANGAIDGFSNVAVQVACRLWKGAAKYGNFSYHIVGLDAGVVIGQLLADSPEGAKVHFVYVDSILDDLLGVPADLETVYAVVLTGAGSPNVTRAASASPSSGTVPDAVGLERDAYHRSLVDPVAHELASASRITDRSRLPALPVVTLAETRPARAAIALPSTGPLPAVDMALRRSAVSFQPRPVGLCQIAALLSEASRGFLSDIAGTDRGGPPVGVYCVLSSVEGTENGTYQYDPAAHALVGLRAFDPGRLLLAALYPDPNLPFSSTSLFITGAPTAAPRGLGARWYRITNMLAGLALQRMCRAAAAIGLGARPNLGFYPQPVAELLDLPPGELPLVQLLIGYPAPRPGCLDLRLHVDAGADDE